MAIADVPAAMQPAIGPEYLQVFLKAPTPLVLVDAESLAIVAVNEAATKAFGYAADEFLSRTLADFVVSPVGVPLAPIAPTTLAGLVQARSSWTIRHRQGPPMRLEVAPGRVTLQGHACVMLFRPPEGEPTGRDVGAGIPDLPEFSFSALHDLKEPLHLIKGYLSLLRQRAAPGLDPEARQFLEYAFAGTERMQAIVANILEFLRAQTRGIAPEPVDLDALWAATLEGLRLQVREAGAAVTADPLPVVLVDRTQFARVLQNLLSNALKFRKAAPTHIHLGVRGAGADWEFWLEDDGIGIDAKDQERVLQPFQRVYSSDRYPGTGLGLSICRSIVELHGGRLWIESTLGHGTTVRFTLPKATPPPPLQPAAPAAAPQPPRGAKGA